MTQRFLAIKNFERFQHYSDRNPPWIKLYYALLDDNEFLGLTEVQQIHLVLLWLAATRHPKNLLPYDEKYLRAKIRAKRKVDLDALIRADFLVVVHASTDASTVSAMRASTGARPPARPGARPPRGREEVAEVTELQPPPPPRARSAEVDAVAERLSAGPDRLAFAELMAYSPAPGTWAAEIRASLDAMAGHTAATPEQVGQAIREFVGNGAHAHPNLRSFRRYIEQAASPASARRNGQNGHGKGESPGERSFANAVAALGDDA